jgi:hypothetical protein
MMNTHRTYLAELFGVRPLRGSYPEAPLATSPAVEVLGAAVLLGVAGRVLLDAPLWASIYPCGSRACSPRRVFFRCAGALPRRAHAVFC